MCDLTQNLWLNLTDGTILCGRKYFDGSGGNDHAVKYYSEKGSLFLLWKVNIKIIFQQVIPWL